MAMICCFMARIARITAPGFPHHVVQRGNNKEQVFFDDQDRKHYIGLLIKYTDKWLAPVLAYCLMDDHVHLLIRPHHEISLDKIMQGIAPCYTQYINRKHKRTGRLWECRYYSSIIDTEKYLWSAVRYIEQNPVRANYVKNAEDYPFSSAPFHINGVKDNVIGENIILESERKDYTEYVRSRVSEKEINNIREHTRSGKPFGSDKFINMLENILNKEK